MQDTLPAGSSGNQFEIRKSHGSVETRKADVVTNMFKLTIKAGTLYHYDVTFERKRKDDRKRREDSSRQEEPGVVVSPVCACCNPSGLYHWLCPPTPPPFIPPITTAACTHPGSGGRSVTHGGWRPQLGYVWLDVPLERFPNCCLEEFDALCTT